MEFVDDVPPAPGIDVGPSPDDTGEVCVGGVESGPEEDGSADDALDGCKGVLEVVGVVEECWTGVSVGEAELLGCG